MIIRKYNYKDRFAVEYIQFETYFFGKSLKNLVDNKKYISEEIKYYLEKEPQSCFVAEEKGRVIGYLLGCLNNKSHDEYKEFFGQLFKTIYRFPFMSKKDRKFWGGKIFKTTFNAITKKTYEFKIIDPKDCGHIHINLLPEARGKGIGSKLLNEFFKYAKENGCKRIAVHTWKTKLNNTEKFWKKNGFKAFCEVKRASFWKGILSDEEIGMMV